MTGRSNPGAIFELAILNGKVLTPDPATYLEPDQPCLGIKYLLVNGIAVIDNGKTTGASPGRFLRAAEI